MAAELKKKITKIDKLVFIYKMELPGDNQVLQIEEVPMNKSSNHRVQPDNGNYFNFTQFDF